MGGLLAVLLVGVGVYGGSRALGAEDGVQIFGGRVVPVAPGDDRVELGVLFGGAEIRVPADARVRTEGSVIFGGVDCERSLQRQRHPGRRGRRQRRVRRSGDPAPRRGGPRRRPGRPR